MSKPKPPPSAPVGLAALPTLLNAKETAEAVLAQLHESGAIAKDQIDKCLPSITQLVQKSNDQQEKFWKSVYASVNAIASHSGRTEKLIADRERLFTWLDQKMPIARKNLDGVAQLAASQKVVLRGTVWIRKQITEWNKLRKKKV